MSKNEAEWIDRSDPRLVAAKDPDHIGTEAFLRLLATTVAECNDETISDRIANIIRVGSGHIRVLYLGDWWLHGLVDEYIQDIKNDGLAMCRDFDSFMGGRIERHSDADMIDVEG